MKQPIRSLGAVVVVLSMFMGCHKKKETKIEKRPERLVAEAEMNPNSKEAHARKLDVEGKFEHVIKVLQSFGVETDDFVKVIIVKPHLDTRLNEGIQAGKFATIIGEESNLDCVVIRNEFGLTVKTDPIKA